jgi:hypothetical protein
MAPQGARCGHGINRTQKHNRARREDVRLELVGRFPLTLIAAPCSANDRRNTASFIPRSFSNDKLKTINKIVDYAIMLITQFNELEDLDKYLNHPVHLEVSKYIEGAMETSASLCYRTQ